MINPDMYGLLRILWCCDLPWERDWLEGLPEEGKALIAQWDAEIGLTQEEIEWNKANI